MPEIANQKVERVKVDRLSEHPENPRKGDMDAISESLDAHGFYGVIVAQSSTGHILAGNHRYRAAVEQGMTSVPVAWLDVDDEEALRIVLVDNRSADRAGYDTQILASVLQRVSETAAGFRGTAYTSDDLKALLGRVARDEQRKKWSEDGGETFRHEDRDQVLAETHERWQTKLGETWIIDGQHRMFIGDTFNAASWDSVLAGEKAKMLITSPPYWVGKEYEQETTWDEVQASIATAAALWAEHVTHRISINTGTVNATKLRGLRTHYKLLLDDWQAALEEHEWLMRSVRIWNKSGAVLEWGVAPAQDVVDMSWEFIATFYTPATYEGQRKLTGSDIREPRADGGRDQKAYGQGADSGTGWAQTGVWTLPKVTGKDRIHSAPFHPELPSRLMMLYTDHGDRVIDPFLGSGTTILAAAELGRVGLGIELDPAYAALALDRMADAGMTPARA